LLFFLFITLDKLISWAKAQPINLKPKAGKVFGYGYADPRETPPEEWRFDLALTVPKDFKLSDEVIDRELAAGRYAVTNHAIISAIQFIIYIVIGFENLVRG